jgi:NAD(P)-dependent dehydrogenase (short-subunit alcohol dehydrogenase family)
MSIVLITGASAGIGRETAIRLAERGHHVIAAARTVPALEQVRRTTKGRVDAIELDVTSQDSVDTAKREIDTIIGENGIDVLINNAAYTLTGPLEAVSDAELKAQFETNVFGPMRMIRAFVPKMRARKSGRIVNISSVVGRLALPFFGPYTATKHAIEALSDSLRNELRPFGIDVVIIEPGAINTGLTEAERQALEHHTAPGAPYADQIGKLLAFQKEMNATAARPEVVARAIVRAVEAEKPRARYVVPLFRARALIALAEFLPTEMSDAVLRGITGLRGSRTSNATEDPT